MRNKGIAAKIICIMAAVVLSVVFYGCSENTPPPTAPPGENQGSTEKPKPDDGSYTLLVYMCGSSLETKNGAATEDLAELLCADIPEKVNIVIETGGARRWKNEVVSYDKIQRYKALNGELTLIGESSISSMGDASTLRSFIDWGTETFPAERTGLILWDHGGGFLEGVCMDELYRGDWLTVSELDEALSGSRFDGKFSFIGFDCCLMANYETALTVSKYADVMIASEGDEPVGGWDYEAVVEGIGKTDFYDIILDSFLAANPDRGDCTLSVIDLSKLDIVRSALLRCIDEANASGGKKSFQDAVKKTKSIGSGFTYLYDFGVIAAYFGVECDLGGVLKTTSPQGQNTSGLSVCCPIGDENALNKYLVLSEDKDYCEYLGSVRNAG